MGELAARSGKRRKTLEGNKAHGSNGRFHPAMEGVATDSSVEQSPGVGCHGGIREASEAWQRATRVTWRRTALLFGEAEWRAREAVSRHSGAHFGLDGTTGGQPVVVT